MEISHTRFERKWGVEYGKSGEEASRMNELEWGTEKINQLAIYKKQHGHTQRTTVLLKLPVSLGHKLMLIKFLPFVHPTHHYYYQLDSLVRFFFSALLALGLADCQEDDWTWLSGGSKSKTTSTGAITCEDYSDFRTDCWFQKPYLSFFVIF